MSPVQRALLTKLMRNVGLRPHIELALPARLFFTCAANVAAHPQCEEQEHEFCRATMPVLREACNAPFAGLDPTRRQIGTDLTNQLNQWILLPFEHRPRAVVYTMLIHFLNDLVEDGTLSDEWPAELHEALNSFVEVLNQHPDVLEEINRSAAKNARRLREQLRGVGLYLPPKEAAA